MLSLCRCGGQNGADFSGVLAAYDHGFETKMLMPKGFKTLDGPKPEYVKFGAIEHESDKYPPRTYENVRDSDATIRFAVDFQSSGEKCTSKAIEQYKRLYFDVTILDTNRFWCKVGQNPTDVVKWLLNNSIERLNIAGNSERTANGIEKWVYRFMNKVFLEYKVLTS